MNFKLVHLTNSHNYGISVNYYCYSENIILVMILGISNTSYKPRILNVHHARMCGTLIVNYTLDWKFMNSVTYTQGFFRVSDTIGWHTPNSVISVVLLNKFM